MKRIISSDKNADEKLISIYETLLAHYGDLRWWPADTPYEVMVGAVLTQNTAWGNVEKAITNFGDNLTPEFVSDASLTELAELIRPSGFFNQKAAYLKAVTSWFKKYDYDIAAARSEPIEKLRAELLSVKGVGRETADSILLYALGVPTFVVDAYTIRLRGRYPLDAGDDYETVKAYFEAGLPPDARVYNNYHALIVINGKHCCRKKPLCASCPLTGDCEKIATTY